MGIESDAKKRGMAAPIFRTCVVSYFYSFFLVFAFVASALSFSTSAFAFSSSSLAWLSSSVFSLEMAVLFLKNIGKWPTSYTVRIVFLLGGLFSHSSDIFTTPG